jgi:hypothetical protein
MNALTVHIFFGEIELRCPQHGVVAAWPSGVELADIGAAEQDHAAEHVARGAE